MRLALLLSSLLLGSLVACSDDGGSSSKRGGDSPVAKCESYLEHVCDSAVRCELSSKSSCIDQVKRSTDCSRVTDITDGYDACIAAVDRIACDSFVTPAECKGVILSGGNGSGQIDPEAPTKCEQLSDQVCGVIAGCQIQDKPGCLAGLAQELPCAKAVQVSSGYAQCVEDLKVLECPASGQAFVLPGACKGSVLFLQSLTPPAGTWQSLGVAAQVGLSVE